jgi:uncharacterized delta-60 repeat protein
MSSRDLLLAAAGQGGEELYVEDVFSTYLYTGNGATQAINNGIALGSTAEWSAAKIYDGGDAVILASAVDSTGDVIVVGIDYSTPSAGVLLKYSPSGSILWQRKVYESGVNESLEGVSVDSSNNIYVFGRDRNFTYALLVKYNTSGTLQWQRKIYQGDSAGRKVAVDASGNAYVTGYATDSTRQYIFTAKYNTSGVLQWQRKIYQGTVSNQSAGVAVDSSGNVYISGRANDGTRNYILVAKYNTSGVLQWQRKIYQLFTEEAAAVAVDSSANIFITGRAYDGTRDYALVAKYNTSGVLQWQRKLYQGADTFGYGVATDSSGNLYVTGYSTDPNYCGFVAKYNTSGVLQWQRKIYPVNTIGYGVCVDSSGNILATGESYDGTRFFGFVLKLAQDGSALSGEANGLTLLPGTLTDEAGTATDAAGTATDEAGTATDEAGTATDEAGTAVFSYDTQPAVEGQGGLVWVKRRNGDASHQLSDTDRGDPSATVNSNTSDQSFSGNGVDSFSANGFVVSAAGGSINSNTQTFASWTFRKAPKFFDIVTFTTGSGSFNLTVPHSLASAPGAILFKATNSNEDWLVYHRSLGSNQYLVLNTTAAAGTQAGWVSVSNTSFTVNNELLSPGTSYVAYIFAHDAGGFGDDGTESVISCGSFTTNGSGNATVSLGFEPQWLFWTSSSTTSDRFLQDSMRGFSLTSNNTLFAQNSDQESIFSPPRVSPTATGFTVSHFNSTTYAYIAIRRGPMKKPTSGTEVFAPVAQTSINGANTVTTGFPVDSAWMTARGVTFSKTVADRLRGGSTTQDILLFTNSTNAETNGTGGYGVGFDNNSAIIENFVIGGSDSAIYWNFRRAPGFFDVVCFTATENTTTAHNLTVEPELVIFKPRSGTSSWYIGSRLINGGSWGVNSLAINTTSALINEGYTWMSATGTVVQDFSNFLGAGSTCVAYLFATLPGVSKVGTYTGNGSSQTINCGFAAGARFILIKRTDSTGDWYVWDTARGIVTANDPHLSLNTTAAEVTTDDTIDPQSSGFIVNQVTATNVNVNAATYLYLAIA